MESSPGNKLHETQNASRRRQDSLSRAWKNLQGTLLQAYSTVFSYFGLEPQDLVGHKTYRVQGRGGDCKSPVWFENKTQRVWS